MTDYIASDWIENTGTVPAGVGPDTRVGVEYRYGRKTVWEQDETVPINEPGIWSIDGGRLDVLRFRFLETPAERDARIARGVADLLDAGRVAEQAGRDGE